MERISKLKFVALLVLAVLALVQGATAQYLSPGMPFPRSDLFFLLPEAVLVFVWYRLDSIERAFPRSVWLNIGVVGIALLALPYYFFRSRGALKGFLATAVFLGYAILWGLLVRVGAYATYYGVQT